MTKNNQPISGVFVLVIILYQCLWHVALPFVLVRLWWKGRKEPGYRAHILERLGFYRGEAFTDAIWVHAVSVGETRASAPLIHALVASNHRILLTHTTPTGRKTGLDLFQNYIDQGILKQCYLPYDFCWPVSRFFRYFKPSKGLLMETEVWPSILFFSRNKLPIYLVNGRLSLKSSLNFAKFGSLSRELFGLFKKVLAQTPRDAEHYALFGILDCPVTGNLKFDVQLDPTQIIFGHLWKKSFGNRQVITLASSREGEEEIVIRAWAQLKDPKPLLLIVPRHLPRTIEIERFLNQQNIAFTKRSIINPPINLTQDVLIGDTMGEMASYLSMADYVVMGGTLMETGGQNLIEPISLGKPVILGPSTFNFADISQAAIDAGVACQLKHSMPIQLENELSNIFHDFQNHPQKIGKMSLFCSEFAKHNQGATAKTLNYLNLP
ncbi:3-deoxy-D-manno-octulosonic acid transferase [Polynucleobacter sp. SHI8]|uniref:3-deoxy-D-manno-octulosonic acid transferase n=1 Tax=unclassified Polynucleobacter TaxID=2640945 RepID=UPI0024919B8A|nr:MULTISPECIES: 3-deoxy-D-manno-octulosonic acid transferase [unclassified Polynucleobacter]BDW11980.1 3-deoxy-D-manno-octulosonic acid transferase [Polynucleobacter sp. SHI2]BDW14427.1 3-deoxy-D-manno-octulosonic acid transferase [Polynucleobacter sp. SHI8]